MTSMHLVRKSAPQNYLSRLYLNVVIYLYILLCLKLVSKLNLVYIYRWRMRIPLGELSFHTTVVEFVLLLQVVLLRPEILFLRKASYVGFRKHFLLIELSSYRWKWKTALEVAYVFVRPLTSSVWGKRKAHGDVVTFVLVYLHLSAEFVFLMHKHTWIFLPYMFLKERKVFIFDKLHKFNYIDLYLEIWIDPIWQYLNIYLAACESWYLKTRSTLDMSKQVIVLIPCVLLFYIEFIVSSDRIYDSLSFVTMQTNIT